MLLTNVIGWSDSAYHLTSAAIVLLRCAIEEPDQAIKESCKSSLVLLRERLRLAKDVDLWDLGDICLAQCEEQILRVTAPCHVDNGPVVESRAQDGDSVLSNHNTQLLYTAVGGHGSFGAQGNLWTDFWDTIQPMDTAWPEYAGV